MYTDDDRGHSQALENTMATGTCYQISAGVETQFPELLFVIRGTFFPPLPRLCAVRKSFRGITNLQNCASGGRNDMYFNNLII